MERRPDRIEIYRGQSGDYYWRKLAPNGRIIADSGEGYRNRADCLEMARRSMQPGDILEACPAEQYSPVDTDDDGA